jgi:antitoxin (DNA-binding transcriptional repressor) of toxin-antitoxin stability system
MIKDEMTLRLTEAELARDIHTVLARVRQEGLEVIVEQDHRPVAVIKTPQGPGRKLANALRSRRRTKRISATRPLRTRILLQTFKRPLMLTTSR